MGKGTHGAQGNGMGEGKCGVRGVQCRGECREKDVGGKHRGKGSGMIVGEGMCGARGTWTKCMEKGSTVQREHRGRGDRGRMGEGTCRAKWGKGHMEYGGRGTWSKGSSRKGCSEREWSASGCIGERVCGAGGSTGKECAQQGGHRKRDM